MTGLAVGSGRFTTIRPARPVTFRLGLDLDNCAAQYERGLADHAEALLGRSMPPLTAWDGWEGWGLGRDEFFRLHDDAVDNGLFARLAAVPGVTDAMWALSDHGVAIAIVTSRLTRGGSHKRILDDTSAWLDEVADPTARDGRAGIPYVELHVTGDKASVACDLYIDDAPHNIDAIRAVHGRDSAIVFDRPYNRHLDGPRINRWGPEAVGMVLAAKARKEALIASPPA